MVGFSTKRVEVVTRAYTYLPRVNQLQVPPDNLGKTKEVRVTIITQYNKNSGNAPASHLKQPNLTTLHRCFLQRGSLFAAALESHIHHTRDFRRETDV